MRLSTFLRRRPAPAPLPLTQHPVGVVGDVHGRDDLLAPLLDRLAGDGADLVLVGDYVDRGPASAAVLARLMPLAEAGRIVCLMGNHERMMLDFLDAPATAGRRWLLNGGAETLPSYGLSPHAARIDDDRLSRMAEDLRRALPAGTEGWLRALPRLWQSGGLAVAHAGAAPDRPLHDQEEDALLWGHRSFRRTPREDGVWVAHGHWIVPEPVAAEGRIAVDTGAWRTGRLSAARIGPAGIDFVEERGTAG